MAKKEDEGSGLRRNGKLTRAGMVDVIKKGGSVIHNGVIYSRESDLPDEAELTEGDAAAAQAAVVGIDAQIAALAAQRAALEKNVKPVAEPPVPKK